MIQDDPTLEGVAAIVFDEFHERHLSGDLGLALALDVQSQLRPDLRLVVMSATLDGETLARFIDAPRLSSARAQLSGRRSRTFPARRDEALAFQLKRCVDARAGASIPATCWCSCPGSARSRDAQKLAGGIGRRSRDGERARRCHCTASCRWSSSRGAAARSAGPSSRGAGDQRRRIQRDAAGRARGDRRRPRARAALRPQQRLLAAGDRDHLAGLGRPARRPRRSRRRRLRVTACGRNRSGWSRRARRKSPRSNWPRCALELAAWGSERAALRRCAAGAARWPPRANCCSGSARWTTVRASPRLGTRMLALGTHPRLAAMLLSRTRRRGTRAGLRPGRPARSARSPAAAIAATTGRRAGRRWRRSAPAAHRRDRQPRRAGGDRPGQRSNGDAACAANASRPLRRRRTGSATCCCMRFPNASRDSIRATRAATSWPTGAWRASSMTARCSASPGSSPANCASMPATRWCNAARRWTKRGCARDFPARFVERDFVHWDPQARALQARRERALRPHHPGIETGRPDRSGPGCRSPVRGRRRTRARRAAVDRWPAAMARTRALPARVDAGTRACPICPTRPCSPRAGSGCSRRCKASRGWMRWAKPSWPRR